MNYGNCGFRRSFQFKKTKERSELLRRLKREWQYHVMILPAMILLFIFSYIPMFGLVIAFQKFNPIRGVWKSPFIGQFYLSVIIAVVCPGDWKYVPNCLSENHNGLTLSDYSCFASERSQKDQSQELYSDSCVYAAFPILGHSKRHIN